MRIRAFLTVISIGLIAACAAPTEDDEPVSEISDELRKTCGTGQTVPGLDISYFEGNIDFAQVRASGQRWVIARTNDGTFVDPKFVSYYKGAKAAGLLVGAYMFY